MLRGTGSSTTLDRMSLRSLLFDLDGTHTDPRPGFVRSIQHALRIVGGPARSASQLEQFLGPPLHQSFAEILETDDQRQIWQAMAAYREPYSTVGYAEARLHSGIRVMLEQLASKGIRLWVATSKPTVFATRVIEHFSLRPFFDGIKGSELSGERSLKSEVIRDALHSWSIRPTEAMMIGDRHHDIEGAHSNRVRGIGVLWGIGSRQELETAGADLIVDSPSELFEALLVQT